MMASSLKAPIRAAIARLFDPLPAAVGDICDGFSHEEGNTSLKATGSEDHQMQHALEAVLRDLKHVEEMLAIGPHPVIHLRTPSMYHLLDVAFGDRDLK